MPGGKVPPHPLVQVGTVVLTDLVVRDAATTTSKGRQNRTLGIVYGKWGWLPRSLGTCVSTNASIGLTIDFMC